MTWRRLSLNGKDVTRKKMSSTLVKIPNRLCSSDLIFTEHYKNTEDYLQVIPFSLVDRITTSEDSLACVPTVGSKDSEAIDCKKLRFVLNDKTVLHTDYISVQDIDTAFIEFCNYLKKRANE
jgi:hypothetical protein